MLHILLQELHHCIDWVLTGHDIRTHPWYYRFQYDWQLYLTHTAKITPHAYVVVDHIIIDRQSLHPDRTLTEKSYHLLRSLLVDILTFTSASG